MTPVSSLLHYLVCNRTCTNLCLKSREDIVPNQILLYPSPSITFLVTKPKEPQIFLVRESAAIQFLSSTNLHVFSYNPACISYVAKTTWLDIIESWMWNWLIDSAFRPGGWKGYTVQRLPYFDVNLYFGLWTAKTQVTANNQDMTQQDKVKEMKEIISPFFNECCRCKQQTLLMKHFQCSTQPNHTQQTASHENNRAHSLGHSLKPLKASRELND